VNTELRATAYSVSLGSCSVIVAAAIGKLKVGAAVRLQPPAPRIFLPAGHWTDPEYADRPLGSEAKSVGIRH
jgi:hypothetical protein